MLSPHPPHTLTAVPKELRSKSSSSFACMLVASPSNLATPATGRPAVPSPAMACFFLAALEKEGDGAPELLTEEEVACVGDFWGREGGREGG